MAVGAREHLVGHDVLVRVAGALRRDTADEIIHVHHRHHRDRRVEQASVDPLALPGAIAVRKGCQQRDGRVHAGHQVGDRDAGFLRAAAGKVVALAGDAHEPGHALDDEVIAGAICVRPVLAEAGDRRIDEARIDRSDAGVVEPVFRKAADLEVLDERIGVAGERQHEVATLGLREVDRDRPLAAIARQVIRGFPRVPAGGVLEKRRPPRSRVVAGDRFLDLDHRRAEVGEQLRAPRPGEHA